MRTWIWAAVLLTTLGALTISACRRTPDEIQVRQAIASGVRAAEEANAGGVVAILTDDFDGNAGALDRRALSAMVRVFALRGESLKANLGPISIERRGQRLVASFSLTLRAGGRLLPEQMGVYQVESAWRNEDGRWRCYNATWKQSF
ncbi:MAG: hypothetical protein ABI379_09105 [Rhodanobacter sp.]